MKKLNDMPKKNERAIITAKNKILVTKIPENGIESKSPQVNGMMETKI